MTVQFDSLGLPAKLLQSLVRMKFTTPTPIQAATIPLVMQGRDVLGSAQTGTGKTGAFGIPLIAKLMADNNAMAVVMTPTRELATQVLAALQQMVPEFAVKSALLIGGESIVKQLRQLQSKPRLIVGTPGRINDHLARNSLNLSRASFLVLDETDRMLDMGFGVQIDKIVQKMPKQRQSLMFSATMPPEIVKLSGKYMNNPERVSVGSTVQAAPNVRQEMIQLKEEDKYTVLLQQLDSTSGTAIVFVKTKFGAERLAKRLLSLKYQADTLHGDLRQSRRDRVTQMFREKKFRILVATDVAARGLDISHIEMVVNYDLPQCPEDYIHRVGRTARAGASGVAVNLLTPADREKWRAIHKLMHPGEKLPEEFMPRGKSSGKPAGKGGPAKYGRGRGKPAAANSNGRPAQGKPGQRSGQKPGGERRKFA